MKFAHLADCHIGGWRDPKLKCLSVEAFIKAINKCINENVDFVLISGDLFNTSLPGIDSLKPVVKKLKELKDNNIPVYTIAGSHDFSPSGKTILDVLEEAGLLVDVVKGSVEKDKLKLKFTIDKKTGVKITGMLGKRGMLEKRYYEALEKENLEKETGFKIFMFHTALSELKPAELEHMESSPLSLLPKNFDYYAGGHVHYIYSKNEAGYGLIAFPGPTFPNNFAELEKLGCGGFYIYENDNLRYESVQVKNVLPIEIDAKNKSPEEVYNELAESIKNNEFLDTIVLLRVYGRLREGQASDIKFKEFFKMLYDKSAYFVMKNTLKLTNKEFEEIKVNKLTTEEIEDSVIKEHLGQIKISGYDSKQEEELARKLITTLDKEKNEGEKVYEFEARLKEEINKILNL